MEVGLTLDNSSEGSEEVWTDDFVAELESRYKAYLQGKEKSYTLAEIKASIEQLRQDRL